MRRHRRSKRGKIPEASCPIIYARRVSGPQCARACTDHPLICRETCFTVVIQLKVETRVKSRGLAKECELGKKREVAFHDQSVEHCLFVVNKGLASRQYWFRTSERMISRRTNHSVSEVQELHMVSLAGLRLPPSRRQLLHDAAGKGPLYTLSSKGCSNDLYRPGRHERTFQRL